MTEHDLLKAIGEINEKYIRNAAIGPENVQSDAESVTSGNENHLDEMSNASTIVAGMKWYQKAACIAMLLVGTVVLGISIANNKRNAKEKPAGEATVTATVIPTADPKDNNRRSKYTDEQILQMYYPEGYTGYRYPVLPYMSLWQNKNHEERIEACRIPKDVLADMTTTDLLQSVLWYPLMSDYSMLLYEDHDTGYETAKTHFSGLKELSEREDRIAAVLQLLDEHGEWFSVEVEETDDRPTARPLANLLFLIDRSDFSDGRVQIAEKLATVGVYLEYILGEKDNGEGQNGKGSLVKRTMAETWSEAEILASVRLVENLGCDKGHTIFRAEIIKAYKGSPESSEIFFLQFGNKDDEFKGYPIFREGEEILIGLVEKKEDDEFTYPAGVDPAAYRTYYATYGIISWMRRMVIDGQVYFYRNDYTYTMDDIEDLYTNAETWDLMYRSGRFDAETLGGDTNPFVSYEDYGKTSEFNRWNRFISEEWLTMYLKEVHPGEIREDIISEEVRAFRDSEESIKVWIVFDPDWNEDSEPWETRYDDWLVKRQQFLQKHPDIQPYIYLNQVMNKGCVLAMNVPYSTVLELTRDSLVYGIRSCSEIGWWEEDEIIVVDAINGKNVYDAPNDPGFATPESPDGGVVDLSVGRLPVALLWMADDEYVKVAIVPYSIGVYQQRDEETTRKNLEGSIETIYDKGWTVVEVKEDFSGYGPYICVEVTKKQLESLRIPVGANYNYHVYFYSLMIKKKQVYEEWLEQQ